MMELYFVICLFLVTVLIACLFILNCLHVYCMLEHVYAPCVGSTLGDQGKRNQILCNWSDWQL